MALTRWSNGLASVWLPNAILLTFLLLTPRHRWAPACAAVLVSGTLANWLGGAPGPVALVFGISNVTDPLIVALMMRARSREVDLERFSHLLSFVGAAALANGLSATAAAGAMTYVVGGDFGDVWTSWFLSSFLGLVIVTPILMIGYHAIRHERATRRKIVEAVAVLALVAATGVLAFTRNWPIFFIVHPPLLIATFRLRAIGAGIGTLILAVIGTVAISLGVSPTEQVVQSFGEQMALLQAFLCVAILTALPIAAALSERDRVSRDLAERETQFRTVVDAVSDVIFRTDAEGRWTYLNSAWENLTGSPTEEAIGRSVLDHVVEDDRAELVERLRGLTSGLFTTMRHQFRFRTVDGEHRWAEVQSRRLEGPDGEMVGSAGIIVDISDRLALAALADDARQRAERDAEAAILLAATDELTGLASRRAFLAMLDKQLESGMPLAVALFDIDHFKLVNDRFGHGVGDAVLQQVAAIASACVREDDLIGRIGGEEFAVLMPGAPLQRAAIIGDRIRRACAEAVHPPGLTVTISIGVTAASENSSAASLLKEADAALYRAKFEGRNCLRLAA
jgi:diguanylate cyclase (GGDEF)-like protein/PAS domain S-box-containing protein